MEKRLLTAEEAAVVTGVGRTTIYALMADGEIESVKIGCSRRVPVDALDRYIRGLRAGTGLPAA